jgi:hypothetical protein
MCFGSTTSTMKKNELMKQQFSYDFHYQIMGWKVQIIIEYDNVVFKQPEKVNEVERALVQAQTTKLLNVSLVELSKGEYVLSTMTSTKKILLPI